MVLLMASLFIGSYVLDFFGVSIGAVQLGGGLVVVISGWRILNQQSNDSDPPASALFATIGIVLIGITIFLCYRYADGLQRLLGPTGTSIVIRLSAFILVCIGIQIMFNGANQFYAEMVHNARLAVEAR